MKRLVFKTSFDLPRLKIRAYKTVKAFVCTDKCQKGVLLRECFNKTELPKN